MNERRLLGSKEDLNRLGTWKTGYEIQNGDIIYGVAVRPGTYAASSCQLKVSLYNASSYVQYFLLAATTTSYGLSYSGDKNYISNAYLYRADGTSRIPFKYNTGSYNWSLMPTIQLSSQGTYGDFFMPGIYIPMYWGASMSLKNSSGSALAYNVHMYYDGQGNTFPQGEDSMLFLVSDIPQEQ